MSRVWKFLRREPIVHFAAAGALLFLLQGLVARTESKTIRITSETERALVAEREALLKRPLTEEERAALIRSFIEEEILLREAYAIGLDRADPAFRNRLVDKMRFILDEEPVQPTKAELEAYLRAHPERYRTPEAVTFDHVFFENGSLPREDVRLAAQLEAGADFRRLGERFWLGPTLERYAEPELARWLGADFARCVFALSPGKWSGPIRSERGLHFVRVRAKHPPEIPAFEALAPTLREDWLAWKRNEIQARKIEALGRRYRIEVENEQNE